MNNIRKKINVLNIVISVALSLVISFGILFSSLNNIAYSGVKTNRYLLVTGDSRTCALISAMREDKAYKLVYESADENFLDAIFLKGDLCIAVCAEAGGRLNRDSFTTSTDRLIKLTEENSILKNADSYTIANLYGFNDILQKNDSKISWQQKYIQYDKNIKEAFAQRCKEFYQFTAGPIDENGEFSIIRRLSNADIERFNRGFINDEDIKIVDLFTYLMIEGFEVSDKLDTLGIHYDEETSKKILDLLVSYAK